MIEIRPADDGDREGVLALWQAVNGSDGRARRERLWAWRWHDRPATPGYRGVIAVDGARVAGSIACFPAGLYLRGQPAEAVWLMEALVHPESRRQGIISRILAGATAFGWALAKDTTQPMLVAEQKAGFRFLPASGYWERTLTHQARLGRLAGARAGRLLRPLADIAVPRLPALELHVELHKGDFDPRFDALWDTVATGYAAICKRDAAYLQWRFRRRPGADYRVLTAGGPGGQLRGYAICRVEDRRRRRRGILSDILAAQDDSAAQRALVVAACRCLADWGADSVRAYVADTRSAETLRSLGFRPLRASPMTARGAFPDPYVTLQEGDGD